MQLQQLQHFLAAVTYGNLGRAAEFCSVTQPAISRSIQRLEETLGTPLLERTARGVTPTAAGSVLYEYARQLARDTRLVRQRVADVSGQALAEVRIGVSANVQHEGLAEVLLKVMGDAPERKLSIVQDFHPQLLEKLAGGEIDALVTMLPEVLDEREFSYAVLRDVPGALFVNATHPLLAGGRASLLHLTRYRWVVLGPRDHGYLARRFGPYDMRPPDVAVTTNSLLLMKELLLARPMIGIAPRHIFAAETRLGNLVALASELDPISAPRCIMRRRNAQRSPQLDRFIDDFQAAYLAVLPPGPA